MKLIVREKLAKEKLPGRIIQKVVGKDAFSRSTEVTVGFGHYSAESGPMAPHQHAEEVVHILDVKNGWVRYGPSPDRLGSPVPLEVGMTLHFPELEWHVFEYDRGGYLDIIFFYGRVENIRPEEILKSREKESE